MNTHGSCSDPLLKGVIASMIRINQSLKPNNWWQVKKEQMKE